MLSSVVHICLLIQKQSRFGGLSFEHSAGDRSGYGGWYNGISGTRGTMEELSAYTRYPRRQRFYSTDHHAGTCQQYNDIVIVFGELMNSLCNLPCFSAVDHLFDVAECQVILSIGIEPDFIQSALSYV